MSVNKAVLLGNLGSDPRVKVFKDNNKLVTLSIATNSTWIDKKTNERKEVTDWHTILLRNKIADVAEKYLKKGDKIYVKGTIRTRHYINHKGEKHKKTEVIGKSLQLISGKVSQSRLDEAGVKAKPIEVSASQPVSTVQTVVENAIPQADVVDNTSISEPVVTTSEQDNIAVIETPVETPTESNDLSTDSTVTAESTVEAVEPEVTALTPVVEHSTVEHTDLTESEAEISATAPDEAVADEDAADVLDTDDQNEVATTEVADEDDDTKEDIETQKDDPIALVTTSNPYDDIPYNIDDSEGSEFLELDSYYDFNDSLQFADSHLSLLADEFNREALEAQQQDSAVDADEDLPDWLLP